MTDKQILDKIKELQKQSDNLYITGKLNQFCKIEDLIFKYNELLEKREPTA